MRMDVMLTAHNAKKKLQHDTFSDECIFAIPTPAKHMARIRPVETASFSVPFDSSNCQAHARYEPEARPAGLCQAHSYSGLGLGCRDCQVHDKSETCRHQRLSTLMAPGLVGQFHFRVKCSKLVTKAGRVCDAATRHSWQL